MNAKIKFGLVALGAVYCFYYFQTSGNGGWHFIDNVDLVIHEAGHFIFWPFGRFIMVAGGSLLQCIIPLLFFGYFWRTKQKFSAAAILLWLAVNLFYVGVYAADALRMELPLLGGESTIHDWNYLLSKLGLLNQAAGVANFIYLLGFISIALGVYLAWRAASNLRYNAATGH